MRPGHKLMAPLQETIGVGPAHPWARHDATTAGGRLALHCSPPSGASNATSSANTRAGLAAAARGRKGGRQPVVTAEKLHRAREFIAKGPELRDPRCG